VRQEREEAETELEPLTLDGEGEALPAGGDAIALRTRRRRKSAPDVAPFENVEDRLDAAAIHDDGLGEGEPDVYVPLLVPDFKPPMDPKRTHTPLNVRSAETRGLFAFLNGPVFAKV
jgi:hypothetical protein